MRPRISYTTCSSKPGGPRRTSIRSVDVRELLPLYALGLLEADEAETVELALARDPSLLAELDALQAASDLLVAPVAPPPELHARLLASIGGGRFEKLSSRMASLFDVTVEKAREILGLIERPASWETPMPGLGLVPSKVVGPMPPRIAASCAWLPALRSLSTRTWVRKRLVLTGTLRDHTGRLYGPGDEIMSPEGSEHDVACDGEVECIYAARAMNGIAIAGAPARPPQKS